MLISKTSFLLDLWPFMAITLLLLRIRPTATIFVTERVQLPLQASVTVVSLDGTAKAGSDFTAVSSSSQPGVPAIL